MKKPTKGLFYDPYNDELVATSVKDHTICDKCGSKKTLLFNLWSCDSCESGVQTSDVFWFVVNRDMISHMEDGGWTTGPLYRDLVESELWAERLTKVSSVYHYPVKVVAKNKPKLIEVDNHIAKGTVAQIQYNIWLPSFLPHDADDNQDACVCDEEI